MESKKEVGFTKENIVDTLSSVPLGDLISAPISACIGGFAESTNATLNLVGSLLSEDSNGGFVPIDVRFCFYDYDSGQVKSVDVPLLSLVPLSYLTINGVVCDFSANVSELRMSSSDSVGRATMMANVSCVKDSSSFKDSRYNVLATMNLNMAIGRGDVPQGVSVVLGHLENSISVTDV